MLADKLEGDWTGTLALAVATGTLMLTRPVHAVFGTSPRDLVRNGMEKFRKGDVGGSITDFDALLEVAPSQKPYLWQRGRCRLAPRHHRTPSITATQPVYAIDDINLLVGCFNMGVILSHIFPV